MKNQKMTLKLASFDHRSLEQAVSSIVGVITRIGDRVVGPIPLPTRILKFTLNRSTHVNKESSEQFEQRSHYRILEVYPSPQTIDALKRLDLPTSVSVGIVLGKKNRN